MICFAESGSLTVRAVRLLFLPTRQRRQRHCRADADDAGDKVIIAISTCQLAYPTPAVSARVAETLRTNCP